MTNTSDPLRRRRRELGLSQAEFAERLGVNVHRYRKLERGEAPTDLELRDVSDRDPKLGASLRTLTGAMASADFVALRPVDQVLRECRANDVGDAARAACPLSETEFSALLRFYDRDSATRPVVGRDLVRDHRTLAAMVRKGLVERVRLEGGGLHPRDHFVTSRGKTRVSLEYYHRRGSRLESGEVVRVRS